MKVCIEKLYRQEEKITTSKSLQVSRKGRNKILENLLVRTTSDKKMRNNLETDSNMVAKNMHKLNDLL